jgi:hypothetical protein
MLRIASCEDEVWRDIPEWEGLYQASDRGRVRSLERTIQNSGARGGYVRRRSKVLKTVTVESGHHIVALCRDGKRQTAGVHRLVCMAFHGPNPPGHETAHWDGNPTNNVPSNLRWATRSENLMDRRRHKATA